jgi:ABC-type spermidine/putrescine transport system permease subunit II
MAKVGLNPQLNALSAIFIAATVVVAIISHTLARRKTP